MIATRRTLLLGSVLAWPVAATRAEDLTSPVPGKRIALRGYDPVAYFTDNQPVAGVARYWYEYDDTVYLFASPEHRASFIADPDHYAPQYQGFCAMSVSIGERDEGLPGEWKIVDGRLYVFGRPGSVAMWDATPAQQQKAIIAQGRANWASTHPAN